MVSNACSGGDHACMDEYRDGHVQHVVVTCMLHVVAACADNHTISVQHAGAPKMTY